MFRFLHTFLHNLGLGRDPDFPPQIRVIPRLVCYNNK